MAKQSNYKPYLTGLKGFACFMVMFGHFLSIFTDAENIPFDVHCLSAIRESTLGFLLSESYWLYLFFILSGYLLASSKIEKLHQLFAKCIQRFLRLGLPIFFAYLINFIIYKTIGYHNGATSMLFENTWFQKSFSGDYTLFTVINAPIDVLLHYGCSLNSPFWVLTDMFSASLVIYLTIYLKNKEVFRKWGGNWIIPLVSLGGYCLYYGISNIFIFCFLGALFSWYEKDFEELKDKQAFRLAALVMILLLPITSDKFIQSIFFFSLILFIPKLKFLNQILSSKVINFVGKISFGIYSFHWPIFSSIGALMLLTLVPKIGWLATAIITMVTCFTVTFILSWVYNISFEKLSAFVTNKIYVFLCNPIKIISNALKKFSSQN